MDCRYALIFDESFAITILSSAPYRIIAIMLLKDDYQALSHLDAGA